MPQLQLDQFSSPAIIPAAYESSPLFTPQAVGEPKSLESLSTRLSRLVEWGHVPVEANGPQAIGRTLEYHLGVTRSRPPAIPDLGLGIEVKSTASNRISLFTHEPDVQNLWGGRLLSHISEQREDIEGYDSSEKTKYYRTLRLDEVCTHGVLKLTETPTGDYAIMLIGPDGGETRIATYTWEQLAENIAGKLNTVLLVDGSKTTIDSEPVVKYSNATLFHGINLESVREAIRSGGMFLELRMHKEEDTSLRNHGTVWRIERISLPTLYDSVYTELSQISSSEESLSLAQTQLSTTETDGKLPIPSFSFLDRVVESSTEEQYRQETL